MTSIRMESQQRYRFCLQAAIVGIAVNILLFAVKLTFGHLGGSRALLSDAYHSGGDFLVGLIILAAVCISARPADVDHHYGHWRAESIAQGVVGLVILGVGLNLLYTNGLEMWKGAPSIPESFTMIAALFSIVLKEGTYRYTFHLGRKYSSPVVLAGAYEHRTDALSSIAAFLGIAGATVGGYLGYGSLVYLDLVAGMLVSFLIIRMGYRVILESISGLMDKTPAEGILKEMKREALKLEGVEEIHELKARYSGPCIMVDVVIGVDGSLNVEDGHRVAEKVERKLKEKRREVFSVWVHVHPSQTKGRFSV